MPCTGRRRRANDGGGARAWYGANCEVLVRPNSSNPPERERIVPSQQLPVLHSFGQADNAGLEIMIMGASHA